ncbi:MAG: M14 family metallopeptidase [Candidatus Paceibacterota bacterium]
MPSSRSKKVFWGILIVIILGLLTAIFFYFSTKTKPVPETPAAVETAFTAFSIGTSVQGRNIEAITFGQGEKHLIFIGGIHGGYEWNSVSLAKQFISYLKANPSLIPTNLKITVIPSLNPDGVAKGTEASARFNANNVDLNRNFDCQWQATSTWRTQIVSAGASAFSEPEAKALRDFVLKTNPNLVLFWHSQANKVYASGCGSIFPVSLEIAKLYSRASSYPVAEAFTDYAITGDAGDWLASIKIPAISVELKNHTDLDWSENLAGTKALIEYYR